MAVHPQELENPERDLGLITRGLQVEEAEAEESEPEDAAEACGAALCDRLAAARTMSPPDVACRSCWVHGRDAALQTVAEAGVEAARAILPTGSALHWRDCWTQGRDAVVAALEGR
jgi:hypothetical protein